MLMHQSPFNIFIMTATLQPKNESSRILIVAGKHCFGLRWLIVAKVVSKIQV